MLQCVFAPEANQFVISLFQAAETVSHKSAIPTATGWAAKCPASISGSGCAIPSRMPPPIVVVALAMPVGCENLKKPTRLYLGGGTGGGSWVSSDLIKVPSSKPGVPRPPRIKNRMENFRRPQTTQTTNQEERFLEVEEVMTKCRPAFQ